VQFRPALSALVILALIQRRFSLRRSLSLRRHEGKFERIMRRIRACQPLTRRYRLQRAGIAASHVDVDLVRVSEVKETANCEGP